MTNFEDLLNRSKLDEAKKNNAKAVEAFGTGYFVDPSGKVFNLGTGKTHAEWAAERSDTVENLIHTGWTRMRNFNSPSMNYVQGDANTMNHIWYLIDLADQVGKNKILYWVGKQRIELMKKDGQWETQDGKRVVDITENKIRTIPVITV